MRIAAIERRTSMSHRNRAVQTCLSIAVALALLAALTPASGGAATVTAHRVYSDSDSRTYMGTCYYGTRYAATIRHYLQRTSRRHGWRWEVALVTGSFNDFQTGGPARRGVASYITMRYSGEGFGPFVLGDGPRYAGFANAYGTFSYSPMLGTSETPGAGHIPATPAGWWWHTGLEEWFFNGSIERIDFNSYHDSSWDCQIVFAYNYPWLRPNNQLPKVPNRPPPWYPEASRGYPNP
jgi:hypothetical protein